jgi:hypothetical protein
MRLDDRSPHRQPDPHAVALRREKALEQARELLALDAGSGIGDLDARRVGVAEGCSNGETPLIVAVHRLHRVDRDVGDPLLQLHAVGQNVRQIGLKLQHRCNGLAPQLGT